MNQTKKKINLPGVFVATGEEGVGEEEIGGVEVGAFFACFSNDKVPLRLLGIVDFFVAVVDDGDDGEIEVGLGGMDDAGFDTGCCCLDEVVSGCVCFWVDGLAVNTWEHLRTPHLFIS